MMKIGFSNSRPILFWVGWVCLVGGLMVFVNGKVRAAQSIDSSFEAEVVSSIIQLAQADEEETNAASKQETKEITEENEGWLPPEPRPEKYDWIQLKSGEWLKGKLEVLYDRRLEFDSDELDELAFDFEDIKQIRGHSIFSVRFAGPVTVIGYLQVTETKVYVTWGEDKQEFDRDQLIAIAYGEPKEKNYWSAKLSIGANFTSGNTDQTEYTAIGKVMRRTSGSRFVLDYLGNFTRTENIETVNNHRLDGFFDIFKTKKYFFRPVFAEFYRDPLSNIQRRTTLGAGIGYHIIDTSKTKWDATAGPAYQNTVFTSVEAGQEPNESTPAFVFATAFDTELTKRLDLIAKYNFQIVNQESGSYIHHIITTLETELTKWLDFDISFVWDRTKDPTTRADGTVPEQNDFQLIFSLGVDF
jgi:putative salt-induced outer membrane protein YdiY